MFVLIFFIYVKTSSSEDNENLVETEIELTTAHDWPRISTPKSTFSITYMPKQKKIEDETPKLENSEVRQISLNTNNNSVEGNNNAATDKNTKDDMPPSSLINPNQTNYLFNAEVIKQSRSNIALIEVAMDDLIKSLTVTDVKNLVETAKNNLLEELRAKLVKLIGETVFVTHKNTRY